MRTHLVFAVLSSSMGLAAISGCGISTSDSHGSGAEQLCVDTINHYRASVGLEPLARWSEGENCAADQAQSDSESGSWHGAFGQCDERAQNECPGWAGPASSMITECLAQMWAEGPGEDYSTHGHYINMTSTEYTKVACGFYTLPDGTVWAVQDFQ